MNIKESIITNNKKTINRYKEIDGLRGLAALSVYFSHLIGAFIISSPLFYKITNSPVHILWHGEAAVTLFFLLSGFVLAIAFLNNDNKINLISFYIKRFLRIYPAFIVAILFCLFLKLVVFHPLVMLGYSSWINEFWKWDFKYLPLSQLINTLILCGVPFNTKLFDPVIGTLRNEILVSIIFPLLFLIANKSKQILNIFFLIIFFLLGKNTLALFYTGILIAINLAYIQNFFYFIKKTYILIILFITASVFYTATYSIKPYLLLNENLLFFISVLGCVLLLIIGLNKNIFSYFLNFKIIQFLGKISYSLYLIHFPILLITCSILTTNIFIICLISLTTTICLSYVMYKYIEIPCISLGKKIVKHQYMNKSIFNNLIFINFKLLDIEKNTK